MTLQEIKQRLQDGDTSIGQKILYFDANMRCTSQYWAQRRKELRSLIQYQINEGNGLSFLLLVALLSTTESHCDVYLNCTM